VYTDKTNVTGFSVAGLGKIKPSENVTLFAGPVWTHFTMKGESSTNYSSSGGYQSSSATSQSITKNLTGVMVGASFALDAKTDLRVSYTSYSNWKMDSSDGTNTQDTKINQFMFGIGVKF